MIPNNVVDLVRALAEPVVLVTGAGEIVACSRKAEILLNLRLEGPPSCLHNCVAAPSSSVTTYLQTCTRTSEMLPWAFSLHGNQQSRCRFEGSRLKLGADPGNLFVWIRLIPHEQANSRFVLLNERISELSKEVHARTQAELALRERTSQFETLLNEAPLGVYLVDSELRIQQVNPTARLFFEPGDAIGRNLDEVMHIIWPDIHARDIVERFRQTLATGDTHGVAEFNAMRKDSGRQEYYEWQVNRIPLSEGRYGLVSYFRDISARKQSEEALRNTEKLAATGRLASSIAHEINNPLEGVTNLLYLARQDSSLRVETREYLDTADQELGRVAHIAKQTLGFYRESSSPTWFKVSETVDSVISMYEHRMKSREVKIVRDFREAPQVCALIGEFKQVLSNLLLNALDAMPGEDARLMVRISRSREWRGAGAQGVRISVADNGTGISPTDYDKIFAAFFTTKAATGTGLGLWLSREIVRRHRGHIRVRSRINPCPTGTTFSIFWPLNSE
jgi:PAS domain S-box-containing protein